jgi:hypothetical protein
MWKAKLIDRVESVVSATQRCASRVGNAFQDYASDLASKRHPEDSGPKTRPHRSVPGPSAPPTELDRKRADEALRRKGLKDLP